MQFRYLHKLDPLRSTTKLTGAKPDFSGHLKQKVRFSPMILSRSCQYHIIWAEQISLI